MRTGTATTLLIVLLAPRARTQDVLEVPFDAHPDGVYTDTMIRADWKTVKWSALFGRGRLLGVPSWPGGRCLEMKYPAGAFGPGKGGGQFDVLLPARTEYFADYYLMFRPGFDFKLGGKLPGLTGGKSNTGGRRSTGDGWSARYMWRKGGALLACSLRAWGTPHRRGTCREDRTVRTPFRQGLVALACVLIASCESPRPRRAPQRTRAQPPATATTTHVPQRAQRARPGAPAQPAPSTDETQRPAEAPAPSIETTEEMQRADRPRAGTPVSAPAPAERADAPADTSARRATSGGPMPAELAKRLPGGGFRDVAWLDPYPGRWTTLDVTTRGVRPDSLIGATPRGGIT